MGALFGDVLPDPVLVRRTKAHFDEAFIAEHSRQFAVRWTGTGVDEAIVDPGRLGEEWRRQHPDPRSLLLSRQRGRHLASLPQRTNRGGSMNDDVQAQPSEASGNPPLGYQPPTITYLGDLAELTQSKTVGGADGSTFLGLDIGSI